MSEKVIYLLTSVPAEENHTGDCRAWGWYDTLEMAKSVAEGEGGPFFFECSNDSPFLVIEEVRMGILHSHPETWFRWNGQRYELCEKPQGWKQICGFGMG